VDSLRSGKFLLALNVRAKLILKSPDGDNRTWTSARRPRGM